MVGFLQNKQKCCNKFSSYSCENLRKCMFDAKGIEVTYCLLNAYRDGDVSLQELENVGRAWVAITIMCGPWMYGDVFFHNKDDTLLTVTCQNRNSITWSIAAVLVFLLLLWINVPWSPHCINMLWGNYHTKLNTKILTKAITKVLTKVLATILRQTRKLYDAN